jgi:uncharacterized protein YlaI
MSAAIRKKSARPVQLRTFECPECGTRVTATKTKHKTKPGHIKTMYCYVCLKETDHVQTE